MSNHQSSHMTQNQPKHPPVQEDQTSLKWSFHTFDDLSPKALYEILQLRQAIFVVEQNCPYLDADGLDLQALHILGRKNEELIAYTRCFAPKILQKECVIGRVIVHSKHRHLGLGHRLMKTSEEIAQKQWACNNFYLGAQAHLEYFYQSLGYERCGPNYDEDGIPHLPMQKIINNF